MDRSSRHFVKMSRVAFEDFIRQPAEKDQRSDCGGETEQE
jgi:hypothetical protein